MAVTNNQTCVTLEAGADLSTKQYLFVTMGTDGQVDPSADGVLAIGVLQNDPSAAGRAAEVCIGGITKVKAGGNVAAGARVMSSSTGTAITATGAGKAILGIAVDGGASGSVISIVFQPCGFVPA
jgi:hypothetical protein